MGPRPTTPVNPSNGPASTRVLTSPTGRASTPPRVSVGVSPTSVQRTPTRTFASRGVSPPVLEETLPPTLAAWLHWISQMETIPPWDSLPPPLARAEAISVTDPDNEDERPFPRFVARARSPEVVPETQPKFATDALIHLPPSDRVEKRQCAPGSAGSQYRR
jgi:hypothetical protein